MPPPTIAMPALLLVAALAGDPNANEPPSASPAPTTPPRCRSCRLVYARSRHSSTSTPSRWASPWSRANRSIARRSVVRAIHPPRSMHLQRDNAQAGSLLSRSSPAASCSQVGSWSAEHTPGIGSEPRADLTSRSRASPLARAHGASSASRAVFTYLLSKVAGSNPARPIEFTTRSRPACSPRCESGTSPRRDYVRSLRRRGVSTRSKARSAAPRSDPSVRVVDATIGGGSCRRWRMRASW